MVKTAKNSIKAIIFVTIYVFFIFFISLFKGINLYNIKIPYISVSHIFLKIDKKLILKAENINIKPSTNYQKSELNIHKEFYLFSRILPFFKEIKLKNLKINNKLLFQNINFLNNSFYIFSKKMFISGRFKLKYNVTFIKMDKIKYQNYIFNNASALFYYTPKNIFANFKMYYKNSPVYISLKINRSDIYHSLYLKYMPVKFKNIKINIFKFRSYGRINIENLKYFEKATCQKIYLQNQKYNVKSFKNKITINNKNIYISGEKADILYKKYKIYLYKYNLLYSFNSKSLMLDAKKDKIQYKKNYLTSDNLALNYNFKNKNIFLHTINLFSDINKTAFFSKELLIDKKKGLFYILNNNNIKNRYFTFNTNKIKGDFKQIIISDIFGKIFNFKTSIKSPAVNLQTKKVHSDKITINNVIFYDNIFDYSKKPYIFKTHTSTLFNKNIKKILKYFKINIPVIQKKGKNDINISLSFKNSKKFNIKYYLTSTDSLFKINNFSVPFSYKKISVKGNNTKTNIKILNFIFPYRFLNTVFDANITANIPEKYLNIFVKIKKLDIDKYLEIKNFYEKIAVNLINNYIFLLNSAIFINLNNKTIFFYDLKHLLKYSIFNEIFENGEAVIKIMKNKLAVFINGKIKYPLILNQKNPKNIKANLIITKNNIQINGKNFNVEIKNLTKLMAYVKGMDIDVKGLIRIIKSINKLINKINKNTSNTVNFKAIIQAVNTNFIYKNHKFITKKATFEYNKEIKFTAQYNKSSLKGYTKDGYLLIEGKNYNTKTLIPLIPFFRHFNSINLDFILVRSPKNFYTGKIYIKSGTVKELKALNNLIAFINTIPSLLTLHTPGFSSKGYKIKKGYINYILYNGILYFKQIKINGINLDFNGKGFINLNNNKIKLKLTVIVKIKLKKIPIIGKAISYLFFGKDNYLHVKVFINGNMDDPKIKEDFGLKIESPFILFKRILTLPFNIF